MRAAIKGTELHMLLIFIKGIVHPKIKFCHYLLAVMLYQTCINLYYCPEHKIRHFEECGLPNICWSSLTLIVKKRKSLGISNCLVTHILQYLILCSVQEIKMYKFFKIIFVLTEERNFFLLPNLNLWVNYSPIRTIHY